MFQSFGLPVLLLAFALPFAVGFFSGLTIVYVMTTFPVLYAFPGVAANPLPALAVAYASGYCGTLVSPVHACFVASLRYFKSDIGASMRRLVIPCGVILATAFGLALLYSRFPLRG
jgi:hypothetical protein